MPAKLNEVRLKSFYSLFSLENDFFSDYRFWLGLENVNKSYKKYYHLTSMLAMILNKISPDNQIPIPNHETLNESGFMSFHNRVEQSYSILYFDYKEHSKGFFLDMVLRSSYTKGALPRDFYIWKYTKDEGFNMSDETIERELNFILKIYNSEKEIIDQYIDYVCLFSEEDKKNELSCLYLIYFGLISSNNVNYSDREKLENGFFDFDACIVRNFMLIRNIISKNKIKMNFIQLIHAGLESQEEYQDWLASNN